MTEDAIPGLEVRVRLYRSEKDGAGSLAGFADLTIAGAFVIRGLRVVRDKEGELFVSFPAQKGRGDAADKYFEIAHPVTAQARRAASEAVLAAYRRETESSST